MSEAREERQDHKADHDRSVPPESSHPDIIARFEELGLLDDHEFAVDAMTAFVADGVETVQLLTEAIRTGDAKSCEQLAHRIKGAALNIGASRLGEVARILEQMGREGEITDAGPELDTLKEEFESVRLFASRFIDRSEAA